MSLQASGTVVVSASPRQTLELVLDLEEYRKVDPKIRKVKRAPELDASGQGSARIVGSLWHFPPAPDTHLVHLERWHHLTFVGAPKVFARTLYSFTGEFETIEVEAGTQLTHRYDVKFRQPLTAFFGSAVQRWLDADLEEEMARIGTTLGVPAELLRGRARRGRDDVIAARRPLGIWDDGAVLAVAFGLASGGLVLLMMVAGTKDATNPRPPGGPPGVGYAKAAAETRYQRRRVAIVGMAGVGIALVLVAASAVTG